MKLLARSWISFRQHKATGPAPRLWQVPPGRLLVFRRSMSKYFGNLPEVFPLYAAVGYTASSGLQALGMIKFRETIEFLTEAAPPAPCNGAGGKRR